MWKAIQRHNNQGEYPIDATRVGDPDDLALRSADPDILSWAERDNRIIITLDENESVYIAAGVKHRLENTTEMPLRVIEVQSGDYLGEDDIIRFDDKYGRG